MARDIEIEAHKAWLGFLQPVGLVVSPPALVKAQAVVSSNVVDLQQTLLKVVRHPDEDDPKADRGPYLDDFPRFTEKVLGWHTGDLAGGPGGPKLPEDLEVVLPDYGETLKPNYAVVDSADGNNPLMLVQTVARGTDLDEPSTQDEKRGWHASSQAKFERLLREKEIPAGLLENGHELRLVYAPRGETSGHITFPVHAMCEVPGRQILAAMHMLLDEHRVLSAMDGRRLSDLLSESRKYQNEVSTKLADQVLEALWELLRGFQAADEASGGQLLGELSREDPQHIYGGLLTVLLRTVFLLYAEDQGLMPDDPVYVRNYSVTGLYERLREDAGRYPDTMDQRYGAWAWMLSLYRLVFDGGGHKGFRLPTRHGQLFNPDEYPFLEGRPKGVMRVKGDRIEAPKVSDGCLYRVLEGLLILAGERLSYRALDVEQIGSVYEAMMGFAVERTVGRSIAVKPKNIVFNVDELLEQKSESRAKWIKEHTEADFKGKPAADLKNAEKPEDVVAALGRWLSPRTRRLLPPGVLYLQPGEERRRTGSHYTPRELTEPIVRTTLRPVLESHGEKPTPELILDLKLCDPAMGSGAFLVEACRQLAEKLVEAWEIHDSMPELAPDTEPLLHARRLVAQRCLYGVDKNPFAVNLAKLSLWLVTLSKDHAFTFLDHALKCGDSLVGLTRKQIAAFDWKPEPDTQIDWIEQKLRQDLEAALGWRDKLLKVDEGEYLQKKEAWREAEEALADARMVGDLVIAAFFSADKDKKREDLRRVSRENLAAWKSGAIDALELKSLGATIRSRDNPILPFHWEIEYPEVYSRGNSGFDVFVGNPPFLGGTRISTSHGAEYKSWLYSSFTSSGNRMDLVAYFFRRVFNLVRNRGTMGLVATNTIAQGDTRSGGLRVVCLSGGSIYAVRRRVVWPGKAVVVVSVVHIVKGSWEGPRSIDNQSVPHITSYFFYQGGDEPPAALISNADIGFSGSGPRGQGFIFDDRDKRSTPLDEMRRLVRKDQRNSERIFPYIGGEEVNTHPRQEEHRYIIDFGEMSIDEAGCWPDLLLIVSEKVRPDRARRSKDMAKWPWWRYWRTRKELYSAISNLPRVLVVSQTTSYISFAFLPTGMVYSEKLNVFAIDSYSGFACMQSGVHTQWVRFLGSTMKDDPVYVLTDCFETFPFPVGWRDDKLLEPIGESYYVFRKELMITNDEGLTKTYRRFHDPNERSPAIAKLRKLHTAMDRAVLNSYGWADISTDCDFFLDYEIDEETWGNKKKPYRYRWPDEVHDEVLARLLELNQKRAEEERLAGLVADKTKKKPGKKKGTKKGKKKSKKTSTLSLFESDQE